MCKDSEQMSSPLTPVRSRPIAYSENDIHLLTPNRIPLLPLPESPPLTITLVEEPKPESWLYNYALRFSLHLTLISLFETIFFWHFISESEDDALITLVDNYTAGVLGHCSNFTTEQRIVTRDIFDIFINQTKADATGTAAQAARYIFNSILLRNSWLYFGALLTLFASLTAIGRYKRYTVEWKLLLLENMALVSFLGFYEWMFFSTVVLRYQAISMPELDRMVVDEFQSQC